MTISVAEIDAKLHAPVVSFSNSMSSLLSQTEAIRRMEEGTGRYMGLMSGPVTRGNGAANEEGTASSAIPVPDVVAHELGHNFDLLHAPCGFAPGPDAAYPYSDGSIGSWGYDMEAEESVRPGEPDLMSYCDPAWVSEYHFSNALRFRLWPGGIEALLSRGQPVTSLLLWGGLDSGGRPFLEPAFIVNAPPALPQPGREYRISGETADGRELFSLSFDMPGVADAEGRSSSFAFVLPARDDWRDALANIVLSGPDDTVARGAGTDPPVTILQNPHTGEVVGILRDLPEGTMDESTLRALGFEAGLKVMVSRGVPERADWRR